MADLQLAILAGDEAVLTAVSGVGKRLAGRIVLELREKVAAAGAAAVAAPAGGGSAESEVVAALQALGYYAGRGARGGPRRRALAARPARPWRTRQGSPAAPCATADARREADCDRTSVRIRRLTC